MKSMQPPLAAILFMTNFYRTGWGGGGHGPLGTPSESATECCRFVCGSWGAGVVGGRGQWQGRKKQKKVYTSSV